MYFLECTGTSTSTLRIDAYDATHQLILISRDKHVRRRIGNVSGGISLENQHLAIIETGDMDTIGTIRLFLAGPLEVLGTAVRGVALAFLPPRYLGSL